MLRRSKAEIIKDTAVTIGVLAASTVLCLLLKAADNTSAYASMIFILSVFLISRLTNGYAYGIAASAASVIIVNYIFTFPYFELNFTLSGYPIYILSMLTVSIITSTMTSQNKQQEEVRIESEREKTRSNLLRAISHDLRTPLTGIIGNSSTYIENYDTLSEEENYYHDENGEYNHTESGSEERYLFSCLRKRFKVKELKPPLAACIINKCCYNRARYRADTAYNNNQKNLISHCSGERYG